MRFTSLLSTLLVLLLLGWGCGGDSGSTSPDSSDITADSQVGDGLADSALLDSVGLDSDLTPLPDKVLEKEELGAEWACTQPADCTEEYEAFLEKAPLYTKHVTQEAVMEQLRAIDEGQVALLEGPMTQEQLRSVLLARLGIAFLMEEFDERVLIATTVATADGGAGYSERHLLLKDPWVGTFEAYLLVPNGEGPFPAVVALHGHDETAQLYRETYHGNDYPAAGYAILFLTGRVLGTGDGAMKEHKVSLDLLTSGYTLMGLRVYEAILGLKYLRHLAVIDSQRIGIIGHETGSSTANLAIRVEPGFKACVTDRQTDYAQWAAAFSIVNSESIPDLYPYSALVNDFTTSAAPVLVTLDKYPEGMEPIYQFFDSSMK